MVKKHIVILNWQFPPNKGIGGRRCAKLAQEWLKEGHCISVLTQLPQENGEKASQWIDQQTSEAINYFWIKKKNDFNALYFQSDLFSKIKLNILRQWHSLFTKGNPIDDTRFAQDEILHQLEIIHSKQKIDFLFCSSAPFSLSIYACLFKKQNPETKVWCDFRDPWKNATNYGMTGLSPRQKEQENSYQKFVSENADFISAPYDEILEEFSRESRSKKILIPHFTDRKPSLTSHSRRAIHPILTYAGNYYEHSLPFIIKALNGLKKWGYEEQPRIKFIGQFPSEIQLQIQSTYPLVAFKKWMNDGLDEELSNSDGILLLHSEFNKNFRTTKYFDYLTFGKPYLYIGPNGAVLDDILKNKLGCSLEEYSPEILKNFIPDSSFSIAQNYSSRIMALKILEHAEI